MLIRCASVALASLLFAPLSSQSIAAKMKAARAAWDRGDYPAALTVLIELRRGKKGDALHREIALLTGELHPVREIAKDGRRLQLSGDGRFASYQVPQGRRSREVPVARVVALEQPVRTVVEMRASACVLAADGSLAALVAADRSRVTLVDLATGSKTELAIDDRAIASVAIGDAALFVLAGEQEAADRTDIFSFPREKGGFDKAVLLTKTKGFKSDLKLVPGGRYILYSPTTRNPLAAGGRRGRRFRRFRRGTGSTTFIVVDRRTGDEVVHRGSNPVVARDTARVAFAETVAGSGTVLQVMSLRPSNQKAPESREVVRIDGRIPAFDISPNGESVVYQARPKDDWELFFVTASDGGGQSKWGKPRQLTQEIQHDLNPVFLDDETVLAQMGEPRHRRVYVYDGTTGRRMRLFHNNTIRTIAPQYEWKKSADGTRVLILAERDGNTVTPDRSVYLVDRRAEVSRDELLQRLQAQLAAERSLREKGTRMFEPIAAAVRTVTESVTVARVREYQKKLAECGSRHITQPGNRKAREYLAKVFQSFGYEPELQKLASRGRRRSIMGSGGSSNVLAVLKGTVNPELVYVIGSHYDSVSRGPGADDNATGTAVTLEAARVLAKNPQPATILFVAFTGEESGLLGSREFVRQAGAKKIHVVGALNNDMLGWANDFRIDNTIRYSNPGIRDVQHNAAMRYSRLITYDALYYKGTDAAAFYDAWGDIVGGIGSYPVLGNPHYHRRTDQLPTINHEQVAATAKTTVATLMLLASSPSRINGLAAQKTGSGKVDVTWQASPEKGIMSYEVVYGPEAEPQRHRRTVKGQNVVLENAKAGDRVAVRAINDRGLHGWDWARTSIR